MRQIPSAKELLVVSGDFEAFSPQELFDLWTIPEQLQKWWPELATIDANPGGQYRLEWPAMSWVMQGEIDAVAPGEHIGFTWNWNHEPDKRERRVDVYFQPLDAGSRLAIYHGPFGTDDNEQADRQGILEGWIHFGMRLAGLAVGASE
jgi:uncharacterized protein YndB with AHSA1/START domain